uniref:Uncharacterized protein n=1 Tax=Amphimedon queenslandica TaxID=400682 RepID=A0A1X7U940_AMPQE
MDGITVNTSNWIRPFIKAKNLTLGLMQHYRTCTFL